jgi:glucose/arabinose dehydrogenase
VGDAGPPPISAFRFFFARTGTVRHMTVRFRTAARAVLLPAVLLATTLAGCGSDDTPPTAAPPSPVQTATGPASPTTSRGPVTAPGVAITGTVSSGIEVPWGLAFLPDGSALVAERNSARIVRVPAGGGDPVQVGTVSGVQAVGEGGLLGLAVPPADATGGTLTVYAYFTASGDNRIVRMPLTGDRLGEPSTVLEGIPAGGRHNGGRMIVGPDGKLWIGTGEAGEVSLSQDRENLGGKILRLNLDGTVPDDNPFPGSPVWSWGHRNVQGLAFDSAGQLWATEFGQNEWDELNRIQRGGNYGWPDVEGKGTGGGRYIEPEVVWTTDEASPSGLAIVDDVAYVAGLRGRRLWQIPLGEPVGTPRSHFTEQFGRLRTVEPAPGGGLWLTTSNRDGRGDPTDEDDRIIALTLR